MNNDFRINRGEINRLNKAIAAEEQNINLIFQRMGQIYFTAHREDPEESQIPHIQAVKEAMVRAARYKDQINTLRGIVICPNCKAEVSNTAAFCSCCGTRLPKQTPPAPATPAGKTCPNCGNACAPGTRFCNRCGTRLPEDAPAAAVSQPPAPEPIVSVPAEEPIAACSLAEPEPPMEVPAFVQPEAPAEAPTPAEPETPEDFPASVEPVAPEEAPAPVVPELSEEATTPAETETPAEAPAPTEAEASKEAPAQPTWSPIPEPIFQPLQNSATAILDPIPVPAPDAEPEPSPAPEAVPAPGPEASGRRFCRNCGTELEAGWRFCLECGTPV